MYIEYELYNLELNKTPGFLYEHQIISAIIVKWYGHYTIIKYLETRAVDYM